MSDSQHLCLVCGQGLACRAEDRPLTVLQQSSGKPNVWVVLVNGREIHRCGVREK